MGAELREDTAHLGHAHLRPDAAEDAGGEFARQPDEGAERDRRAERPQGDRLQRMRLALAGQREPWRLPCVVHAALLTAMRASVSTSSRSNCESRCCTRKERWPTFQSAQPRRRWGRSSALGVGQPEQLPCLRKLVGWLRVADLGLGVREQPLGEPELATAASAGGVQVREPVQHDDVLRAERARELERLLQPLADAEVREDPPGLVDDDDPLFAPLVSLRFEHRLQPRCRTGHEDPERRRVRVQHRAEVEDDERRGKLEARRRRPVEHAAKVPGAELIEGEGHRADGRGELFRLHRERIGHLRRCANEDVHDAGQSWLAAAAPFEDVQRLLCRTLLLRCQRPFEHGGRNRVEEVELAFGALLAASEG